MEGVYRLDPIDRNILRILSLYGGLDLLQLWYELGESDGPVNHMTKEEVLSSLESLRLRGLVERITEAEGVIRWVLKRGEIELD